MISFCCNYNLYLDINECLQMLEVKLLFTAEFKYSIIDAEVEPIIGYKYYNSGLLNLKNFSSFFI